MAEELRLRQNFLGGLIENNPLASGGTALNSAALAAMAVVAAPKYMPIVLDPDGMAGEPEIVYVTAHTAAATTATILRAQEGSTARAHDRDVEWSHGPTLVDFVDAMPNPDRWFKADALGLANGASVTTWLDSANDVDATLQGTAPLFSLAGGPNGLPCVQYTTTGGHDFVVPLTPGKTLFVVATMSTVANTYLIGGNGAGDAPAILSNYGQDFEYYNQADRRTIMASGTAGSGWHRICAVLEQPSTVQAFHEATRAFIGAPTVDVAGRTFDGINNTAASRGTFDVAEVILYNRALPKADRLLVDAYLRAKYALTP